MIGGLNQKITSGYIVFEAIPNKIKNHHCRIELEYLNIKSRVTSQLFYFFNGQKGTYESPISPKNRRSNI